MTLLGAFVVHELKLRARMPAFWFSVVLYVVACMIPAVAVFLGRDETRQVIGATTYLTQVYRVQPLLTALLSTVLAVNAINRERDEGSFAVVTLTPMSSAGYLLRRWLALQTILLPVTLLPVLGAAALGAAAGASSGSPAAFVAPWLLHIVPLALSCSALALGLGTITSGFLAALLAAAVLFTFGLGLVNDVLALFGRHLGGPASWLGADENFGYGVGSFTRGARGYFAPSTEGPYDLRAAAEIYLARGGPFIGLAALSLGLAARYLRRMRRNLRPWSIRKAHPLRTFLKLVSNLRAGAVPDPRPWTADRLAVVAGAALCLVTIAWSASRDGHFRQQAGLRYATELGGEPDPMPKTVLPGDWKLSGEIGGAGDVRLSLSAEMINRGPEPAGRLTFQLNPLLDISRPRADAVEVRVRRVWDRLVLSVDPPLPPDGSLKLEMEITGAPGNVIFNLSWSGSFVEDYGHYLNARYTNELRDLSRSRTGHSVSPRRVALDAEDLLPVPRYTPWTLTPPSQVLGRKGKQVPPEAFFPPAGLEMRLEASADLFLADSCGHLSIKDDDMAILSGSCRLPLSRLAVRGGTMRPVEEASGVGAFAVLDPHRDAAALHLASLADAGEMVRRAWPEADLFQEVVVLEWPPSFNIDATDWMWIPWKIYAGELNVEAAGRLLLLPERLLIQRTPLPPAPLAGEVLVHALMNRRAVTDEQTLFFEKFFRWLAAHRMGVIVPQCVVSAPRAGRMREELGQSILESGRWDQAVWNRKLPALMSYVERRAGSRAFMEGVRAFLAGGAEAGSTRELFAEIERHAGISLDRIYEDYLAGSALPELTLAGVESAHRGTEWTVTGEVVNAGAGETVCPVVLQTDVGAVSTEILVKSAAATSFRLRTPHPPRTLLLDPDRHCFRLELKPKVEIVDRVELARPS